MQCYVPPAFDEVVVDGKVGHRVACSALLCPFLFFHFAQCVNQSVSPVSHTGRRNTSIHASHSLFAYGGGMDTSGQVGSGSSYLALSLYLCHGLTLCVSGIHRSVGRLPYRPRPRYIWYSSTRCLVLFSFFFSSYISPGSWAAAMHKSTGPTGFSPASS